MSDTDRDELAALITKWLVDGDGAGYFYASEHVGKYVDKPEPRVVTVDGEVDTHELADALLAAGWRAPRPLRQSHDHRDADVSAADIDPNRTVIIRNDDRSRGVMPWWTLHLPGDQKETGFRHGVRAMERAAELGYQFADLGTKNWFGAREPYCRYVRLPAH